MKMHTVVVELDEPEPDAGRTAALVEGLRLVEPAIGVTPRGRLAVTVTLPATSLTQALLLATSVVEQVAGRTTVTVSETLEVPASRSARAVLPDLVSLEKAAELLGTSIEAVRERIRLHTLPAFRVDKDLLVPRSALDRALERDRSAARPSQ